MSDENFRDRRPTPRQSGGEPPGSKGTAPRPGPDAKRTVVGMPLPAGTSPAHAEPPHPGHAYPRPRPGLSGRTPGEPDDSDEIPSARTAQGISPSPELDELDTQYMEPPSEAFGRAATQQQPSVPEVTSRSEPRAPSWQAELDGRANPYGTTGKQPVRPASSLPPSAPDPPRPSPYSANAPEAWRAAARNVADRAKTAVVAPNASLATNARQTALRNATSSAPPRAPGAMRSDPAAMLHLKLDADEVEGYDEHYRGVPKSRLPAVLLALLILIVAAGGGAYWAQEHGGLANVAARLHLGAVSAALGGASETAPAPAFTPPPSAAANTPPPSAAANTPPPSAAANTPPPSAAANTSPPSAAAAPSATATSPQPSAADGAATIGKPSTAPTTDEAAARALAEPDMPATNEPSAGGSKPSESAPAKPATKPQPAKSSRHAVARPIVHHDPVLKIREVGAASATPPEPSDTPYIPPRIEPPPPPDEPR